MALPEYLINKIMLFREPAVATKFLKVHMRMFNHIYDNYNDDPDYNFAEYYFENFHGTHVYCPKCKKYAHRPNGHDFLPGKQALCKDCLYNMLDYDTIFRMTTEFMTEPVWYADNVSDSESEN
jgi:hypothetical protein